MEKAVLGEEDEAFSAAPTYEHEEAGNYACTGKTAFRQEDRSQH